MSRKISNPRNIVMYRYTPGAVGDHMPRDNGAVMSQEFLQRRSAEKFVTQMQADARVQWVKLQVRA